VSRGEFKEIMSGSGRIETKQTALPLPDPGARN
jgi:hypothetical protein